MTLDLGKKNPFLALHVILFLALFLFFGSTWQHMWSYFPKEGLNLCLLQWKPGVLTAGPSGKSLGLRFRGHQPSSPPSPKGEKSPGPRDLFPKSLCLLSVTRLCPRSPGPWNSVTENSQCYFQGLCAKSLQSSPPLCDAMDYSPSCSSVQTILQARILGCVAMPSYRASSPPRDPARLSRLSCIAGRFLAAAATWEALSGLE